MKTKKLKIHQKIGVIATMLACLIPFSTATALDNKPPKINEKPPKYEKSSVGRGFVTLKTKEGKPVYAVVHQYDTDDKSEMSGYEIKGIDIIEYKLLVKDAEGNTVFDKHPYIVITRDESGYVKTEYVDNGKEKDGIFDEVNELKGLNIKMDEFPITQHRVWTPEKERQEQKKKPNNITEFDC